MRMMLTTELHPFAYRFANESVAVHITIDLKDRPSTLLDPRRLREERRQILPPADLRVANSQRRNAVRKNRGDVMFEEAQRGIERRAQIKVAAVAVLQSRAAHRQLHVRD